MKSFFSHACFAAVALSLSHVHADDMNFSQENQNLSEKVVSSNKLDPNFQNFTAKVRGKKVRMRLNADLESAVVQEVDKDELFVIVGEKGNFWAVQAPDDMKAYVFRSFVLDNVVEGNRVNVRLEPDLEAPVIAHLSSGERIDGSPSSLNNKWLEIAPPANTVFYIAKDYLEKVGGPDFKKQMLKRKKNVESLLESTNLLAKSELLKPFEQMDIERITHTYRTIAQDYSDFPAIAEKANEALTGLQDTYLQRKIAFLEAKAGNVSSKKEQIAATDGASFAEEIIDDGSITDKMKIWEPVEEALFLTSSFVNQKKDMQEYYEAQKVSAVPLVGILETYNDPIKNKPGNYILRQNDVPVAYVYSTKVNLERYVGKKISLLGTPRDNNNFAFPAYFALAIE